MYGTSIVQICGGVEQALDVLAQPEDVRAAIRALVGADAFEGADAVVHRVREQVVGGVVPGDELAVDPDRVELLDAHILLRTNARVTITSGTAQANRPAQRDAVRLRTTLRTEQT